MLLFVSYSGTLGGAERLLIGWMLAVEGERSLACPEGPLAEAARANGIRVFTLRERSLELRRSVRDRALAVVRLAAHRRELRALVGALDPDVVVLAGMRSAIAGLATGPLGHGRPAAVFQQSDLLPGPASGRVVRRVARRSDLVLALSTAVATDLDPLGALGDRLRVVHPGIDAERFAAEARPAEPAEVLVLGAIAPSKRPDLALEAFALARRADPELRLRIAGAPLTDSDQQLAATLRARAARPDLAGSVELLGAVADARAELERATVLLHCAPREAFGGMAVLEALAAGRPAVVPDSGGPPRSSTPRAGSCIRRATRRRPPPRLHAWSPTPGSPHGWEPPGAAASGSTLGSRTRGGPGRRRSRPSGPPRPRPRARCPAM